MIRRFIGLLASDRRWLRQAAEFCLLRLGNRAIGPLLDVAGDPDSRASFEAYRLVTQQACSAPSSMAVLVSRALAADEAESLSALFARGLLAGMAPSSTPAVVAALEAPNGTVRTNALRTIADMGPAGKDALPAIRALRTRRGAQPLLIAEVLASVDPVGTYAEARAAIRPRLRACLPVSERLRAVGVIGRYGPAAGEFRPVLRRFARSRPKLLAREAALVLSDIAPGEHWGVVERILTSLLGADSARLRERAAIALGRLGPHARAAVPALAREHTRKLLDSRICATALLQIGGAGHAELREMLLLPDRVPIALAFRLDRSRAHAFLLEASSDPRLEVRLGVARVAAISLDSEMVIAFQSLKTAARSGPEALRQELGSVWGEPASPPPPRLP